MNHYGIKDLYIQGSFIMGTVAAYLALQRAGFESRPVLLIGAVIAGGLLRWVVESQLEKPGGPGASPGA